jgi:hypothetical protein
VADISAHANTLDGAQVGVDPREGGMPLAICRAALARSVRPDTLAAVREAETECHAEEQADG